MDLFNDSAEYWAQQEDTDGLNKSSSSDSDSDSEEESDLTDLEESDLSESSDSSSDSSETDNEGPTAAKRSYSFHPRQMVEAVSDLSESKFREMFRMNRGN